jgi:CheY-like chemotaxis protein/two-component sensor histidine kinase
MTGQIERISSILKNLMGFARPVPPKLEKLSVRTLLDKSLALIQGTFARDSIRLERDYQPDLPSIKGDASQLEGVFLNLLINAQHAMEGRGGVLRVEAKAGPDGKRIVVSIADQGIGIPEHNLAKIFDPFFTTKEEGKGTGLGLSTAYGIISNHDGTVTVRSKVGQGTTVTVELPADVDLPVADGPASRPVQDEPARTSGSILVVDDEVSILEILKEALEGEGFHVDTARNGQEGSERLRTASYRMVLLDIRMPLKTGLSLLADIKKAHPAMPVIVITGLASGEEMDKALALGAYKCIQKPFQIKPLLLDVHAALGAALGRAAKPARAGR